MKKCQRCDSRRIIGVQAHCSDLCTFVYDEVSRSYYVPDNVGIGGGDDCEFEYCAECGQIQGQFPIPEANLDAAIKRDDLIIEMDEKAQGEEDV